MKLRHALEVAVQASTSPGAAATASGERVRKLSSESNSSDLSVASDRSTADASSEGKQKTEAALEQVDYALLRLERSILVFSEFGNPEVFD